MNSFSDVRNDFHRALSEYRRYYKYADKLSTLGFASDGVVVRVGYEMVTTIDLYPTTKNKNFSSRRDRQNFYLKQMHDAANFNLSDIDLSSMLYVPE